jgi:sulfite reductase alpha subunit-like flavoprotein
MLQKPDTHIFVAGMETMLAQVEKTLEGLAGQAEWARRKNALVSSGRWSEVLY